MSTKVIVATATVATSVAAGIGLYYLYRQHSAREKMMEERLDRIMSIFDTDVSCKCQDSAILRGKIRAILNGGKERFQILTDFDKTLSSYFVDGGLKGHSSFQVIEESSQMGASVQDSLKALHAKYYPLEMSPTLSSEEKTPLMIEWYKSSFNIGLNAGIQKALLPSMVKETRVALRSGMDEFFRKVKMFDIPTLVASAGLGDVIDEVFIQQADLPSQVSVLANFYEFNEEGIAVGLQNKEMLHTFNKDKISLLHKPYFDAQSNRTNALVMGDTLGDPTMSNNIDYLKCILKVGFLNSNVENSLTQYLSVYDLVLTRDASMAVVNVLLQELFGE